MSDLNAPAPKRGNSGVYIAICHHDLAVRVTGFFSYLDCATCNFRLVKNTQRLLKNLIQSFNGPRPYDNDWHYVTDYRPLVKICTNAE